MGFNVIKKTWNCKKMVQPLLQAKVLVKKGNYKESWGMLFCSQSHKLLNYFAFHFVLDTKILRRKRKKKRVEKE